MDFGKNLKKLRIEKGLTQEQLGEALGISSSAVSSYENNKVLPNEVIKNKIGNYFQINIDQLLNESTNERYESEHKIKLIDVELNKMLGNIHALNVVFESLVLDILKSLERIDRLNNDLI